MSKPDWTEAPDQATHYDCNADVFCTVDGWWSCKGKYYHMPCQMAWGSERYTPRPVSQTDRTLLTETLNWYRNESDMGVIADSILELGFRITKP